LLRKSLLLLVALTLCTALPLTARTYSLARQGLVAGDFRAFYCGARVASEGRDPYEAYAIGACESERVAPWLYPRDVGLVLPAPMPGYTFALLAPLARLPYATALYIWVLLSAAAIALCAWLIARMTGFSGALAFATLALPLAVQSLPCGELEPIALAAICGAAYCLTKQRWTYSALCAALSMLEPHLGLPVCLAMFVLVPQVRAPLVAAGALLAALSLAAIGVPGNVEYFARVLPQHALSEVGADFQYSLAVIVHGLGVSANASVRIGELFYVGMLALGVFAARAFAQRTGNRAFIALLPAALVVIGGPFIHLTQIVTAVPLLLLLAASNPRAGLWLLPSLLLLATPWMVVQNGTILLASIFPAGYIAWWLSGRNWHIAIGSASAVAALALGLFVAVHAYVPSKAHQSAAVVRAEPARVNELAEAPWGYVVQRMSTGAPVTWMLRAPTWIGLLGLLAYVGIALASRPSRRPVARKRVFIDAIELEHGAELSLNQRRVLGTDDRLPRRVENGVLSFGQRAVEDTRDDDALLGKRE
jgi:Glycosyltransferase family 87